MITVYGQPGCGPCHAVIRRLEKAEVPHQYVDLTQNPSQHQRLAEAGCQQEARAIEMQQHQRAIELRKQQEAELS